MADRWQGHRRHRRRWNNNSRRRTSSGRYGEPLLLQSQEHPLNDSRYGNLSPRGDMELIDYSKTSSSSLYQPPPLMAETMVREERVATGSRDHLRQLPGNGQRDSFRQIQNQNQPAFSSTPYPGVPASPIFAQNDVVGHIVGDRPVDIYINPLLSHGLMCCQCVRTNELGFMEQCGRFEAIVGPGLYLLAWPLYGITSRLSLRMTQLEIAMECNTRDQVFCHLRLAVQYRVAPTRAYEAYYRLANIESFLTSVIIDAVRSRVPGNTLDDIFSHSRKKITDPIMESLFGCVLKYGFELGHILLTHIRPHSIVRQAMNEINACKRGKLAASYQAQANKINVVAQAQAHAERTYLLGVGTARQRRALVEQFWLDSVHQWINDVYIAPQHLPTNEELLTLLLITQYFEVITSISLPSSVKRNTAEEESVDRNENREMSLKLLLNHNDLVSAVLSPMRKRKELSFSQLDNTTPMQLLEGEQN